MELLSCIVEENTRYGCALDHLKDLVKREIKDTGSLILDVGAGTGLTGTVINDEGYTNLHALEPCARFALTCREKGIYSRIHQCLIGDGQQLDIPDNFYDAVVTSGAFGPGAIPCAALPEMARIVKPGGIVIIVMREEFTWTVPEYKDRLEPRWNKMGADGVWTMVSRSIYPNHLYDGCTGLSVVFTVT